MVDIMKLIFTFLIVLF